MRIVLLIALALLAQVDAIAQQKPQLRVVVDGLNEAATKCGVTESQLTSIANLTLRNNGVQATNSGTTNPFLAVVASFMITARGDCIYNTRVWVPGLNLTDKSEGRIGAFKARETPTLVLCSESTLSIAPRHEASSNVTQVLEELIKQCLGKLDY